MTDRRLTLAELLRRAMDARQAGHRGPMPGRVVAYNPAAQTVDVQPAIIGVLVAEDGELPEPMPVVPDVPLLFPRAGQFFLTFPVTVGDPVLLVVCERSIDEWRATGNPSLPADLRMHSLADVVAVPGLYPATLPVPAADVSAVGAYLGKAAGPGVHVTAVGVELGGSVAAPATAALALAPATDARFQALENKLNAVILALNALTLPVSGATAGPPAPPPATALTPGTTVAATKVKGV